MDYFLLNQKDVEDFVRVLTIVIARKAAIATRVQTSWASIDNSPRPCG